MTPKKLNIQKVDIVDRLRKLLSDSKSVAVVDYKGLKVSQATELRRAIKQAGGQVIVTKNTLFSLALKANDQKLATGLTGPSAFIFSLADEVSAIRAVADFAKKNSVLSFKTGFLSGRVLTGGEISSLAQLPSKEILITKLLGNLNSPVYGLVYNLNWNISRLVRTLDTYRQKKAG
jgi:large subunit ribosomal protein L10